jgi:hypothetical protein
MSSFGDIRDALGQEGAMRIWNALTKMLVPAAAGLLAACGGGGSAAAAAATVANTAQSTGTATATTGTSGTTSLSIGSSTTAVTFSVTYQGTPSFVRVYVDSDQNASTGYPIAGIGANYLVENGFLFRYAGSGGSWAWTLVTTLTLAESNGVATWTVPLADIGSPSSLKALGNYDSVYSSPVSYSLASAGTRNALHWPFSSGSIWNMPIGSGAKYVASGLHFTTTPNSTQYWYDLPLSDHERIVLTPTAPVTSVYISNVGWTGGNRCNSQGSLFFHAPIPGGFVVGNSTDNNGAAILLADGATIVQTQPFTRCSGYSYATTMQVPYSLAAWEYNIKTGDGRLGAHGASSLSTLGGTIRLGELRPGGTQMRHALKIALDSRSSLGLCTGNFSACFTWPAATADAYAAQAGSGYGSATGNTNSAMKMGALLAIPASVSINNIGLQSVPGKMLAWTLQNYGAYIVDSTGGPGFDISIEDGAAGSKDDEFQSDYGFPFDGRLGYMTLKDSTGQPTPQAKWVSDLRLLIDYLRVVSNNSPSSVGGGGSPLQPLAPAFQ